MPKPAVTARFLPGPQRRPPRHRLRPGPPGPPWPHQGCSRTCDEAAPTGTVGTGPAVARKGSRAKPLGRMIPKHPQNGSSKGIRPGIFTLLRASGPVRGQGLLYLRTTTPHRRPQAPRLPTKPAAPPAASILQRPAATSAAAHSRAPSPETSAAVAPSESRSTSAPGRPRQPSGRRWAVLDKGGQGLGGRVRMLGRAGWGAHAPPTAGYVPLTSRLGFCQREASASAPRCRLCPMMSCLTDIGSSFWGFGNSVTTHAQRRA